LEPGRDLAADSATPIAATAEGAFPAGGIPSGYDEILMGEIWRSNGML